MSRPQPLEYEELPGDEPDSDEEFGADGEAEHDDESAARRRILSVSEREDENADGDERTVGEVDPGDSYADAAPYPISADASAEPNMGTGTMRAQGLGFAAALGIRQINWQVIPQHGTSHPQHLGKSRPHLHRLLFFR